VFAAGFIGCLAGVTFATRDEYAHLIPKLVNGFGVTLFISVCAAAVSVVLALVTGLAKTSKIWPLRYAAYIYAELFRGTSLLVQLFWLFYVLPHFGLTLDPIIVGISGIALNYGAYGSEIVRGAIQSVPRSQWEACVALNLTRYHTLSKIILPQAAIITLPPYANLMIQLLKGSSLVSFITISDLTFEAYQLDQVTGETMKIFGIVLAAYFALSLQVSLLFRWFERSLAAGMRSERGAA
jgi:polar amino acid transport system permease protein